MEVLSHVQRLELTDSFGECYSRQLDSSFGLGLRSSHRNKTASHSHCISEKYSTESSIHRTQTASGSIAECGNKVRTHGVSKDTDHVESGRGRQHFGPPITTAATKYHIRSLNTNIEAHDS